MRKLFFIDLILFSLVLLPILKLVEGPSIRTLSLPMNSSVVGKVLNSTGTVKIARKNLKKSIVARRNVQLVMGDKLVIEASSTAKVICFSPFQEMNLTAGDYPGICQPDGQISDDFTNYYNRGLEKFSSGPGGGHFIPRANEYPKFLAVIQNARPEYLGFSISLNKLFPDDKLLPNDKRSEIINRIDAISNITDDEKRLLRADALAMNGLYEPAIDELKGISNAANDPFIQINLGDLFLAANLGGPAKRAYSSAIKAAVSANDLFGEALAQHALGMVLKFEGGKVSEATSALTRAILLYQELGENSIADSLQSELESLQTLRQAAPKPSIKNILPMKAMIGGTAFTLIVNGTGFIPASVINWNGIPRQTTFVSAIRLKVEINSTDLTTAGTVKVTVTNPPPGGGTSNLQTFTIQTTGQKPQKGNRRQQRQKLKN
jgi:tetratricopeptide (TPR) repeat protein